MRPAELFSGMSGPDRIPLTVIDVPRRRRRRKRRGRAGLSIRFDALIDERADMAGENVALAYWAAKKYAGFYPALNQEDAESACIDGLCKAAKKHREERRVKFSTYATRAMLNEMHRANERAGRMKTVSLTILIEHGHEPRVIQMSQDDRLDLEAAMATLTHKERLLLSQSVAGLSDRQIAVRRGVKVVRVTKRLASIRAKLRAAMEGDE